MKAQTHPREQERLATLRRYDILDTPREEQFDDIASFAAALCEAPVAVLNFIDADRQWFKAEVGLGVRSTPLDTSLCSHVILEHQFVEIPDTLADPRMSDNPLCAGEGGFRFYAGALLEAEDGLPLGTLCILDRKPRTLTDLQRQGLVILAKRVMRELELRLALRNQAVLRREIDHRVKNSLASVGAIIRLQAARSDNRETRDALDAVLSRLTALEAFHEELHQDEDGDSVNFAKLAERAVGKLRHLVPEIIDIKVDVDPVSLESSDANAVALIVNEFVTNSVKHGYSDGQGGTIRINGRAEGDRYRLECSDDGSGSAETLAAIASSSGLGSRIIRTLAESVRAEIHWSNGDPGLRLDLVARPAAA